MTDGQRLRSISLVGEEFPLKANIKACLPMREAANIQRIVRAEWARDRRAGVLEEFLQANAAARESGLGYDLDQHTAGISAVRIGFRN